ncbi:MAG: HNH endonuclease signature motif containing protein, partial [Nitrososphaera sp.]
LCGLGDTQSLTIHHIDGDCLNNVYENMVVLCHNCHQRHHQAKGISREDIERRKRYLIQKTVTVYGINAMKIAVRNNFGVVALPFLLYHLVDLGYMTKEEAQMGYGPQQDATARFAITAKGRDVQAKWLE